MRKIEREMLSAVQNQIKYNGSNTNVDIYKGNCDVFLHTNKIATVDHKEETITINSCGWYTNTTKSRLNVLINEFTNFFLSQRKGKWYIVHKVSNKVLEFVDNMVIDLKKDGE